MELVSPLGIPREPVEIGSSASATRLVAGAAPWVFLDNNKANAPILFDMMAELAAERMGSTPLRLHKRDANPAPMDMRREIASKARAVIIGTAD